jgi:uncharacterized protein
MSGVVWREWGEEAFVEAKSLDKPILLDIGAVWCHWCHVMDHGIAGDPVHTGTYSNPKIAAAINRDYVPIKVDNDRRPDINARYNMGGWPTTAFLTPEGAPLYGATYLTPNQMLGLLGQIVEYYHDNKADIATGAREYFRKQGASAHQELVSGTLNSDIGEFVAGEIRRSFDPAFGGFGMQPKFPHSDAISFAIETYAATGDDEMRQVAERTLVGMASGGMYDEYAGGFFRYSTTRDWSVPHFEKMLQDNTRLIATYTLAYQVLGDIRFKEIAEDSVRFLMDVLYEKNLGYFAGSQDADKEEEYYGRPLDVRAKLPTPYVDFTAYLDWNALAVTALLDLYKQDGNDALLATATKLYDFLTSRVAPFHYFFDGKPSGIQNTLSDISPSIGAALDIFETTGVKRYLSEARGLADTALTELYVDSVHRFRDYPANDTALGSLSVPRFDPDENAHVCRQLIRLSAYTGNTRYRQIAESVLATFAETYKELSYFAASYARAVSLLTSTSVRIVIVSGRPTGRTNELERVAFRTYVLNKTVELLSDEDSGDYLPDADGRAIAYVCIGTTCSRPIADPGELTDFLRSS